VCAQLPLRGPARVGIQCRLWCCRGDIGGLLPRRWRNWVVRWSVHPYLHGAPTTMSHPASSRPPVETRPCCLSRRPPDYWQAEQRWSPASPTKSWDLR